MHMMKFGLSATGGVCRHNDRSIEHSSNEDIDYSQSIKNESYFPERGYQYLKERLNGVYVYGGQNANRKTVYSVGWVATAPKELKSDEEIRKFFDITVQYFSDRFGEQNIIGAWSHFDESTPHLHVQIAPIKWDEKHAREKLCCSDIFNRATLSKIHDELQREVYKNGLNCRVRADQQKDRMQAHENKTVSQLKSQSKERTKEICIDF